MEGFFNTNCTLFILSYVAFQLEYYSVGGGGGGNWRISNPGEAVQGEVALYARNTQKL